MNPFAIIGSAIAICLSVLPSLGLCQQDWQVLSSSFFQIYYTEKDRIYTEELASTFNVAYEELSQRLDIQLSENVRVYVSPSQDVFNELTGNYIPHWGAGVADPKQSIIVLKSPDLSQNYNRYPKLVYHELTHILIGQYIDQPRAMPRWFNEGIAIYMSNDETFTTGKAISKALISDSIIPLDEIDGVLRFQEAKANLAYEESYLFLLYLEERYGFGKVTELIHQLGQTGSFQDTFAQVYGIDLLQSEIDWYNFIEKKYRWNFLLDFESLLWISVVLLFMAVFVAIRLRNSRTLKRWDEEERLHGSS